MECWNDLHSIGFDFLFLVIQTSSFRFVTARQEINEEEMEEEIVCNLGKDLDE